MTSRGRSNSNDLPALLYTIAVLDPVDIAALLCERVPACKDHVTVCRLCFAMSSRFIILNWPYVLDKKIGKAGFLKVFKVKGSFEHFSLYVKYQQIFIC